MFRSPFLAVTTAGLLTVILVPPAHGAQQILRVNGATGNPSGNPKYDTIGGAMLAATAGDTVLVEGMEWNGQPQGYSEYPRQFGHSGESFPIKVKNGVTLMWDGTTDAPPAYVYTTNPSLSELFLIDASVVGTQATLVQGLVILGGQKGFRIQNDSGLTLNGLVLEKLHLCRNETAIEVDVSYGAAVQTMEIKGCWIRDDPPAFPPGGPTGQPAYRQQLFGLSFKADLTGPMATLPSRIVANVSNLRLAPNPTTGTFDQTQAGSSLIDVRVQGMEREHRGQWSQPSPGPISYVYLTLNGGVLDGFATGSPTAGGWSHGILAHSYMIAGVPTPPYDYTAAFEIHVTGTEITRCRKTGIFARTGLTEGGQNRGYSRGHIALGGGASINGIGSQNTSPPTGGEPLEEGAGVYLAQREAYIGLQTSGAEVRDNWGHGIALYSPASGLVAPMWPFGTYLELTDTGIHGNGRDGLSGRADKGIVGGTRHLWPQGGMFLRARPDGFQVYSPVTEWVLPHGQGTVNRCAISNNGGRGIAWELAGNTALPDCFASCRFANTLVWNNAKEGFFANLDFDSSDDGFACLLTPLVHCTIAGNGDDGSGPIRNAEVVPANNNFMAFGRVEDDQTFQYPAVYKYLYTKFWNGIFQRKSDTAEDFGAVLWTNHLRLDPATPDYSFIFVRGLRCKEDYGETHLLPAPWWTDDGAPFVGTPINWLSRDPSQFYLVSGYTEFEQTPNYMDPLEAPERSADYKGRIRPSVTLGTSDKGADHEGDG